MYIQILLGIVLLAAGGECLLRGTVGLARRLGISELLIGLLLVGFGTSMPDMTTSLQAAFENSPGMAIGNVVGSNIANILLIIGLAATLAPMPANIAAFRRDFPVMLAATVMTFLLAAQGQLGLVAGLALLGALLVYVVVTYWSESVSGGPSAQVHAEEVSLVQPTPASIWFSSLLTLAGFLGLIFGANLLVAGGIGLARNVGISEVVIGSTILAVGTSLPELVATTFAAARGKPDVAIGNVIGSNIFNLLGILGVAALAFPLTVPAVLIAYDFWILCGVTAVFIYFAVTGYKINRLEGIILLLGYAAYIAFLANREVTGG